MNRSLSQLLILILLLCAAPAWALLERVYSLAELIDQSSTIGIARVVSVDYARQRVSVRLDTSLKGMVPYRQLEIDLSRGGFGHAPLALRRLAPELPVVLFCVVQQNRHMLLAYTNGTWLQATATPSAGAKDLDRLDWHFTHCEIYLRRTFSGSTVELEQAIHNAVAGKQKPPPPNLATPAGVGPEVANLPKEAQAVPQGPSGSGAVPTLVLKAIKRKAAVTATEREKVAQLARSTGFPEPDMQALAAQVEWEALDPAARFAREFGSNPLMALATYEEAGNWEDTRQSLRLSRDYGRGGDRDLNRTPLEVLRIYHASDWLSWEDLQTALERARQWFSPLQDRALTILELRKRHPWDEVNWLLDQERNQNVPMADLERLRAMSTREQTLRLVDFYRNRKATVPKLVEWWGLQPSPDEISQALDCARDFRNGDVDSVKAFLQLRENRDWAEIRQAFQHEKQWMMPTRTFWELRRRLPWNEIDTALDMQKRLQVGLYRLIELRLQGMNWQQVGQKLQTVQK